MKALGLSHQKTSLSLHSENTDSYFSPSNNHRVHLISKNSVCWKLHIRREEWACNRQTPTDEEECPKTLKLFKVGPRTQNTEKQGHLVRGEVRYSP